MHVHDHMKVNGIRLTESSRVALQKIHNKRSSAIIFNVPEKVGRHLAPARRIHKICKGEIMHKRSKAAKEIIDVARAWLKQQDPNFTQLERSEQVKKLKVDLNVTKETARGAITKLKQMKLLASK